ncbi:MAG: NAD(+)--dinitrogen-reductase ADP-D-ribosyltransferase [Candidatus Competibacteraceae bacterium]|jgi:NAD+--dinitrogen-reductase ADP-D-ribosyltransferase|nr:NAD(+)--dinitrogen-reductase ADP-D-ribosyltransferase [Candidatus Competibacteraceae bacterium]
MTNPCRVSDKSVTDNPNNTDDTPRPTASLPQQARLGINRCNLPAVILGSLTFQHHPVALEIDGVTVIHHRLFKHLDSLADSDQRASYFMDYMAVYFRLEALDAVGLTPGKLRGRADYLRMVRGWAFDPDCREGAVLKAWVESRFGLLTLFHGGNLLDRTNDTYLRYLEARSRGLYNTNALEAQLDLLYTYGQYELHRQCPDRQQVQLYRGFNRLGNDQVLKKIDRRRWIMLCNNLSSFTTSWERADEFGDYVLQAQIPLAKILFYNRMLPGFLKGEDEYAVIGGVYEVERVA